MARECTEEDRHKACRKAEADLGIWLLDYVGEHGLTDVDMLRALSYVMDTTLRHVQRDDEERRTGFRHRLAGE